MPTTLDRLEAWATERTADGPRLVGFVNAACLNIAAEDPEYRSVVQRFDLVLPDGIGVRLGGRMQGVDVLDNVNGTDLFPQLAERAARSGHSFYLLGSADGVASATAELMTQRYPGLRIAGSQHGYFSPEEEAGVIDAINASGASFLFVAMGVPEQEKWLARNADRLTVPVALGVGALFDITSGRVPRAPKPIRAARMEWGWRLAMEPRRMWRRYVLGNPVFLTRAYLDARANRAGSPGHPNDKEPA